MNTNSPYFAKSKAIIEKVRNKKLTTEERKDLAIELAMFMLQEAKKIETRSEHKTQEQLAKMMDDSAGKVFTTCMTDECFRSQKPSRVANQMIHLMNLYGIPKYLSWMKRAALFQFKCLGNIFPGILVPLSKRMIRKETSKVILAGEPKALSKHMEKRRKEGVRINLNHLGEAILGEEEASKRTKVYLEDLARPDVEYISVKISTICSQINLLDWEKTLKILSERLRTIYRVAKSHTFTRKDGVQVPKFVNLDMEEYRDLHLTKELFIRVLNEPEFFNYSAGIVLQSYLPDSHLLQKEITKWAMERVAKNGAPVKIRIVKGANLAMEKVEASLKGWPQAPYMKKADVDANYKRMLDYGTMPEHAAAARLGVASHNLFDISYAMLMRTERNVEKYIEFEMLEGMADNIRRVVQALSGDILLYCPAATKEEFQNAVAYLVRRLDENTAPENFLRHLFGMSPGTKEWEDQSNLFSIACKAAQSVNIGPRRNQNRQQEPKMPSIDAPFTNESDTDWSLSANREWVKKIVNAWSKKELGSVPIVIASNEIMTTKHIGVGRDPSIPGKELYNYSLADSAQINAALEAAEKAHADWSKTSIEERSRLLANIAQGLRKHRGDLIGAMMADGGKLAHESDVEISEAVDFADYYRMNLEELSKMSDISWTSKGTVLVAPPWNFPCSIPLGGIAAALAAGNCVIFKPAPETIYTGWILANICWEAGISKDVLQFIVCEDEPIGSELIKDERIASVVLTGATSTAKFMLKLRPGLDLIAETGGKNAMIITGMSDRDLAIKDLVHSAFGHAGQKCSACSLAICEAEVYDDPHFMQTLKDAAGSLTVGSAWDLASKVNPMIREPNPVLLKALTTLDPGEEWLLEPIRDKKNPNLWSPGIKIGVQQGSFMHKTELFGPVLAIMRADNLEHAVQLANDTPYGLTSGIQSLDEREQRYWMDNIVAGNCYVNRTITGAIVQRQPFGGCKESSFGRGSKAGGPNYLMQFMKPEEVSLPKDREPVSTEIQALRPIAEKFATNANQKELWNASVESYAYNWNNYFSKAHDPSLVLGQDNLLSYVPSDFLALRINDSDSLLDVVRVIAAATICKTPILISGSADKIKPLLDEYSVFANFITINSETEEQFIEKLNGVGRVRFLSKPSMQMTKALAEAASNVVISPVLANGRLELVLYLREVSLSLDYHRYGNLGVREDEKRTPVK